VQHNGAGAHATATRPPSPNSPAFKSAAFDARTSDRSGEPLPEDIYGSVFDRFDAALETNKLLLKWLIAPALIALVCLSIAVPIALRQLSGKPNVMPYVQLVVERCLDPKCKNFVTEKSDIKPVTDTAQSQDIVARGLIPNIIHQMFTVSTPSQDQYDWSNDVLPYLEPRSPAASFAATYLEKNKIGSFASKGTVSVHVDSASPKTVALDGTTAPAQRTFARVEVSWQPQGSSDNPNGMFIRSIEIVDPRTGQ